MTWHFRPFYIATAQGVRPANLQDPEDARAMREYIQHHEKALERRRKEDRRRRK